MRNGHDKRRHSVSYIKKITMVWNNIFDNFDIIFMFCIGSDSDHAAYPEPGNKFGIESKKSIISIADDGPYGQYNFSVCQLSDQCPGCGKISKRHERL